MKTALTASVLLLVLLLMCTLLSTGWSKPVEDEIDYSLQQDEFGDDYEDSIDDEDVEEDNVPNVLHTEPQNFTSKVGSDVFLPCNISGSLSTQVLMWKKNMSIIFQDKIRFADFDSKRFELRGTSLLIKNVQESDEGEYNCVLVGFQDLGVSHKLHVQKPLRITALTSDKSISTYTTGDKMELTCNVEGEPDTKITWSLKGQRYGTGSKLILENIGHEKAGMWQCFAESGKEVAHETIEIKISHKPIVNLEKITTNIDGDLYDVELRCAVRSEPSAIVTFSKDGVDMTGKVARQKNNVHFLVIRRVSGEKFGKYACKAANQIGATEQHVLITNAPSRALYQKSADDNHGREFNLTWEVESLFPIVEYLLEYKKKDSSSWTIEKPEVTNSESGNLYYVNYLLKDLDAAEYEVRVKSRNQYGWSEDSKITVFKARKAHHGHKSHKNQHHNQTTKNEAGGNIAQETRVEGSPSTSVGATFLPSTSLLCLFAIAIFNRH